MTILDYSPILGFILATIIVGYRIYIENLIHKYYMKKTRHIKITDQYSADIEFNDDKVLIWLNEHGKWFFNLIKYRKRVGNVSAYKLVLNENQMRGSFREHVTINGFMLGVYFEPKLIDMLDLKSEIDALYHSHLKWLKIEQNKQKQIDNFINSI